MFQSCRNQSIDEQSKSIDWFLYDWNIGQNWVKVFSRNCKHFESNLACNLGVRDKGVET